MNESRPQSEEKLSEKARCLGNEPASPVTLTKENEFGRHWTEYEFGLTKRELFAAMMMQSICTPLPRDSTPGKWSFDEPAAASVRAADALLKELSR